MCDNMSEEEMKACFDKYAGSDGKLSKREMKQMIKEKMKEKGDCKGSQGLGRKKMIELLKEADGDGDRKLDFEEFKNFVAEVKKAKEEED